MNTTDLMNAAKAVVVDAKQYNTRLVMDKLGVSQMMASILIKRLEAENALGPGRPVARLTVLTPNS